MYKSMLKAKNVEDKLDCLGEIMVKFANTYNQTVEDYRRHKLKCNIYFGGIFSTIAALWGALAIYVLR